MEFVTDRVSNPFGMRLPCEHAVYGYGDVNADFHVIGDHPGVHGGTETGVPFTGRLGGFRLQRILHKTGFARDPYSDRPRLENCFLSYLSGCGQPSGTAGYAALERFVDAEVRAVNAHVLLPIGARATRYVLETHTTETEYHEAPAVTRHAKEIRGRGFLVVPIADPASWSASQERRLVERIDGLLASDYRQTKGVATTVG